MTQRDKLPVPMPRPPHPSRERALHDLRNGDSIAAVSERYGVKAGTVRSWKRTLDQSAPPPANVLPLPQRKPAGGVKKGSRAGGDDGKVEKVRPPNKEQRMLSARSRAISPIDRPQIRDTLRRLAVMLNTHLFCRHCEPDSLLTRVDYKGNPIPNILGARDFHLYSKSYTTHLDRMGVELEAEGRLEEQESTERDADYYEGEEGRAELAADLTKIGPRLLAMVLAENPQTRAIVQAALDHSHRSTG